VFTQAKLRCVLALVYGCSPRGLTPAILRMQGVAGGVAMTECHGVYFNK
jgi:hypothetical protein